MPPSACRKVAAKPSLLCALVCVSIVAAYDRRWLSRPTSSFLPEDVSPERLSRLKASVLPAVESAVEGATRRGRPPCAKEPGVAELAATKALLEVAAATLEVKICRRRTQERLVEAEGRLRGEHGLTRKAFADALGIPARTLRAWANRPPAAPPPPPPPPSPPPPPESSRNLGRFSLDVTPPGLQLMGDTTEIQAFGVKLHLVGAQDPGDRHRRLLQSFRVVPQESSQVVVDVLSRAFADPAGTQAIVDQGKPYIAEATKKALEDLEVDLCPQKEGTPTDKSPLERAWRTIKDGLAPLLGLTDRLATAVPALKNPDLARPFTELLVSTFLRVYLSAASPRPHPLEGRDPLALVEVIERTREHARAETRSKKLLLEEIHARYAMPGSAVRFVRAHRRFHLEDIQESERRLRTKACRCRTRACDRYFAGILSNVAEAGWRRRAAERRQRELSRKLEADRQAQTRRDAHLDAHPEERMREALHLIACQWRPAEGKLLFAGAGLGRRELRKAVATMLGRNAVFWKDDLERAWKAWLAESRVPGDAAVEIRRVIDQVLLEQLGNTARAPRTLLPREAARAILKSQARPEHPPPLRYLRN